MRKIANFKIYTFLTMVVLLALTGSCKKDDDNPPPDNPINGKTTALFNPDVTYGTMTDQEGNIYKTVTIGTQTWMAENLRTTKYRDGVAIPLEVKKAWSLLETGAYCNYNNTTNPDTIATFGRLYNWNAAINTHNIAPSGWHVPTDAEWRTLIDYLGGENLAGGKLKETGTTHWMHPNTDATNETGFTALPGGMHEGTTTYDGMGLFGNFWSTKSGGYKNLYYWSIGYDFSGVSNWGTDNFGLSIRCIKD